MNILIISGFLGAGKTSFIQKLSKNTKTDFVIMENEYGETGIDGDILQQDRLKVWELTEGCICCSLKSDFATSILTIANTINPEYLIVEPTGVGSLSSVISNISKIEYQNIKLLKPITIVDINTINEYLDVFYDLYTDQIKNASQIIISKTENKSKNEIQNAINTLKKIISDDIIITKTYPEIRNHWWYDILHSYYTETKTSTTINIPKLKSLSVSNITIPTIEILICKLLILMQKRFGHIYRAKGFAQINKQWTKFDIVNNEYKIQTIKPVTKSKMVIIGTDLQKDKIEKFFTTYWEG